MRSWTITIDYSDGQSIIITNVTDGEVMRVGRLFSIVSDKMPQFVSLIIRDDFTQIVNLERIDAVTLSLNEEEEDEDE